MLQHCEASGMPSTQSRSACVMPASILVCNVLCGFYDHVTS